MARMSGAKWQPLAADFASQPKMQRYDIVCIHTMVGGLIGTDGYFRTGNGLGYAGTESHFGTGGEGEIVQWQDTAYRADANLDGNHRVISIENADMGPGFPKWNTNDGAAVPAFTEVQMDAIARIVAWVCKTHNIPCELVPDSKSTRRGVAYHRQGVPGYMVAGGEKWSTSAGKVCPGDRRIAQIPTIIKRAQVILAAASKPSTTTSSKPNSEEFDMASSDEILNVLHGYGRRIEQIQEKQAVIDDTLRAVYDTLTPGKEGVKYDGDLYAKITAGVKKLDELAAKP